MKPATSGGPYQVPPEPNRWPAIALAVAVHALLLTFLWFGINWQNNEPVAVEAEVWDMKTVVAAPPPPPPPPEVVQPEPQPEPLPPPKAVEQPVEQAAAQPDIKLEREKKRKELLKKQAEERKLEQEREEAKARELAEKQAREEEKKLEQKKEAARKEAEKKKAEKLAKAAAAAEKARLQKMRADDLKRIMGAAGAVGTAAKSSAPRMDSGYIASISAKVKSTTTYVGSTDVPGNPRVEFRVEQLPTGEVMSVRKIKSSGVAAFDDAVEKGIIKASPLPKKKDGTVERSLMIGFSMKDMN